MRRLNSILIEGYILDTPAYFDGNEAFFTIAYVEDIEQDKEPINIIIKATGSLAQIVTVANNKGQHVRIIGSLDGVPQQNKLYIRAEHVELVRI
jgi:hypothetical protein